MVGGRTRMSGWLPDLRETRIVLRIAHKHAQVIADTR